jgi:hypothetical protein
MIFLLWTPTPVATPLKGRTLRKKLDDTKRGNQYNTIVNRKGTKGQTMIYKTVHRKLKIG